MLTGIDECGEAETEGGRVICVEEERSVNNVEEQRKVADVRYRTRHASEHIGDELGGKYHKYKHGRLFHPVLN